MATPTFSLPGGFGPGAAASAVDVLEVATFDETLTIGAGHGGAAFGLVSGAGNGAAATVSVRMEGMVGVTISFKGGGACKSESFSDLIPVTGIGWGPKCLLIISLEIDVLHSLRMSACVIVRQECVGWRVGNLPCGKPATSKVELFNTVFPTGFGSCNLFAASMGIDSVIESFVVLSVVNRGDVAESWDSSLVLEGVGTATALLSELGAQVAPTNSSVNKSNPHLSDIFINRICFSCRPFATHIALW